MSSLYDQGIAKLQNLNELFLSQLKTCAICSAPALFLDSGDFFCNECSRQIKSRLNLVQTQPQSKLAQKTLHQLGAALQNTLQILKEVGNNYYSMCLNQDIRIAQQELRLFQLCQKGIISVAEYQKIKRTSTRQFTLIKNLNSMVQLTENLIRTVSQEWNKARASQPQFKQLSEQNNKNDEFQDQLLLQCLTDQQIQLLREYQYNQDVKKKMDLYKKASGVVQNDEDLQLSLLTGTSLPNQSNHSYFKLFNLPEELLDIKGHTRFGQIQPAKKRGGFPYFSPSNCLRFGLQVLGKYQNDNWLSKDGNPGEWAVMYHGVTSPTTQITGGKNILQIIAEGGFKLKAGPRQACKSRICILTKKVIGVGVYGSPNCAIPLAGYSQPIEVDGQFGKEKYRLVLQCRVNPDSIKVVQPNIYLVNDQDMIRPYAILLFKDPPFPQDESGVDVHLIGRI